MDWYTPTHGTLPGGSSQDPEPYSITLGAIGQRSLCGTPSPWRPSFPCCENRWDGKVGKRKKGPLRPSSNRRWRSRTSDLWYVRPALWPTELTARLTSYYMPWLSLFQPLGKRSLSEIIPGPREKAIHGRRSPFAGNLSHPLGGRQKDV